MPDDEALTALVAEGDEGALQELLRRYQRPLSNFLYRHTGGQDVEDLYQETWIRVVKNASSFDSSKRFSTWLFHIAVNLCRDRFRRRTVADGAASRAGAAVAEDHAPRALDQVEAALDAASLLALLPEAQREVLILRFYHDLSEQETAAVLDCPVGTVKSRMHNALSQLSAAWSEAKR